MKGRKRKWDKKSHTSFKSQSSVNTGTNCQHNKHAKVQITKHPRNPKISGFLENTNKKTCRYDSQQLNKFYISEAMLLVFTAITKFNILWKSR